MVAEAISVGLCAVVVAVVDDEPRVLVVRPGEGTPDGLPAGPLQPRHRALEAGCAAGSSSRPARRLGYVEQLYTFGDLHRHGPRAAPSAGLVDRLSGAGPCGPADRLAGCGVAGLVPTISLGRTGGMAGRRRSLRSSSTCASGLSAPPTTPSAAAATERLGITFGFGEGVWNEERVLERYELLYEAGSSPEAHRAMAGERWRANGTNLPWAGDGGRPPPDPRHRDRPPARQDQVPAGGVRADAAHLHAPAAAAHGRGPGRAFACTSRTSAGWSSSRAVSRRPAR